MNHKNKKETGTQDKIKNAVRAGEAEKSNLNQNHNTKKVALGPNTDRSK